jgi:hypothetical protein
MLKALQLTPPGAAELESPAVSHPQMAKTIAELRSLSDGELIKQHDKLAESTQVGTGYYLAELERRQVERQGRQMLRLTWVVTALTIVNVVAVVASLLG